MYDDLMCMCRQQLCPSLIQILANPVVDKSLSARCTINDDVGRGSGCSAAPPNIPGCSAKAIYGSVFHIRVYIFHSDPSLTVIAVAFFFTVESLEEEKEDFA